MCSPIPILLVEDNPRDAQLVADVLAADGLDVTIHRVETQAALETALQRGTFQIVLCDYSLPSFDGLTALSVVKERRPELPFILVSGTLGEETAIESLRAGANDYVLKQRMNRLGPAVRRALREAEESRKRRQAEAEILRLNRLYAALSQINQALVRTHSRDELLAQVCRVIVRLGGFKMAWIAWRDPSAPTIQALASEGDEAGFLRHVKVATADVPEGRGPIGTCLRENRTVIRNDLVNSPEPMPWQQEALRCGFRASAAFPIACQGGAAGALVVYADEPAFFGNMETALLEETAEDIAFGLDHLEMERQRAVAEAALRRQTDELKARNEELERWNRLATGRELRLIQLKQQVNELTARLGEPPPYPLVFMDAATRRIVETAPKPAETTDLPPTSGQANPS